ncbi:ABC transporter ATP-binding protein, partial [bacterium]|nr:ABC transporter ATP-binding protein [bacterium]
MDNIIEIKDLCIKFRSLYGEIFAVNNVTVNFKKGFINGIIGESGSGKSTLVYSIVNLLPKNGEITSGTIKFNNKEITNLTNKQLEEIKGNKICFIPQNPMSSLSPFYRIKNQIIEVIKKRNKLKKIISKKQDIENEIIDLLKSVGINEPEKVIKKYPHELSGGMLQRIIISMALIVKPDLLIADEPTTALDVTVQLQILDLIKDIQKKNKMSVIFITHDLGVIAKICDYVSVMYAGNIVETANKNDIFLNPKHEYTKNLIKSMPKFDDEKLIPIKGNPINISSNSLIIGCPFAPRCDSCMKICLEKNIKKAKIDVDHETSCFKYLLESLNEKKITNKQFEDYINNVITIKEINYLDVVNSFSKYKKSYENYKKAKYEYEKNKEELDFLNK